MAGNEKDSSIFKVIDVSEPRKPIKDAEVIGEALGISRRDWIKKHMIHIYAVIAVIIVGAIIFVIHSLYQQNNPMSRMTGAITKNFDSSFDYSICLTEDKKAVMSYDGSISVDRSEQSVQVLYNADYNTYTYTGAVVSDGDTAQKGYLYDGKWTVTDHTDSVQDFFDFDTDFRNDTFDGGAFLRFTGLTSKYSAGELEKIVGVLEKRLSTDSSVAKITSEKTDEGTRYHYTIDLYELFSLVKQDGASLFYRATDYNTFVDMFEENSEVVKKGKCTMDYEVDTSGYMTSFAMTVTASGREYGLTCSMSNFGKAKVELPKDFLKAAAKISGGGSAAE